MVETQICAECGMEFDWMGVDVDDEMYCCEACSQGEPCECARRAYAQPTARVPRPVPTVPWGA